MKEKKRIKIKKRKYLKKKDYIKKLFIKLSKIVIANTV